MANNRVTRQQQLAAICQQPPGRRTRKEHAEALRELLLSLDPLLRAIASEHSSELHRHNGQITQEDLVQEARTAILSELDSYDPQRSEFHRFAAAIGRAAVKKHVRAQLPSGLGLTTPEAFVLRSWHKAHEILAADLSREPTLEEIYADVKAYCLKYNAGGKDPDTLSEEDLADALRRQTKSGITRALNQPELLITAATSTAHIDPTPDETDDKPHTTNVTPADDWHRQNNDARLHKLLYGPMPLNVGRAVLHRLLNDRKREGTYGAVSKKYGVPVAEIKTAMKLARLRAAAPHAHFAFLAGGISAQFAA